MLILLQHLPPLSLKESVCLRQDGFLQFTVLTIRGIPQHMACKTIAAVQNACINTKDVCWIVKPAGIIFTSTARRKILPFPCFTLTEIHVLISAFVACWSKEFHSNAHLLIRYNRDRHTCRNSSSEKLGTYTYIGDPYDQRNYLITVY